MKEISAPTIQSIKQSFRTERLNYTEIGDCIYTEPQRRDKKHSFADINLIKKNLNSEPIINFIKGFIKTINDNSL